MASGPAGNWSSDPAYQQLYNQIYGAAPQWTDQGTNSILQQQGQQFAAMYQNATGQAPTDDVMNNFYANAAQQILSSPGGESGSNYSTDQDLFNAYIQNTYQPQIQANQQQQAATAEQQQLQQQQALAQQSQQSQEQSLQTLLGQVPGIVNQEVTATGQDLMNPQSQTNQAFTGGMNNLGITPSSGAYQAGIGSTLASAGATDTAALLNSLGVGGLSSIQQTSASPYSQISPGYTSAMTNTATGPYQQSLSQMYPGLSTYGTNQTNQSMFNQESALAQQLAAMSEPSGTQKDVAMASSIMQGTNSYVCRELKKRGLICASDLQDFYFHLFDAVWFKARAFWIYKVSGQNLVDAVNRRGLDWAVFKPLLFDRVMEEKDACKAVDLFTDACHQLCISVAPELWDERAYRTSFWDSLRFIPLLFMDKTYGKGFWQILRMKMLWVYDSPKCEGHL